MGVLLSRTAAADEWDKRTILTFSQAAEIPGKVLPAGTYVFQLADSPASRDVVQVFDQDGRILATVLTIPTARLTAAGDTRITFDEQRAGAPFPIKQLFYPGDLGGEEFIYRRTVAVDSSTEGNAALEIRHTAAAVEKSSAIGISMPLDVDRWRVCSLDD